MISKFSLRRTWKSFPAERTENLIKAMENQRFQVLLQENLRLRLWRFHRRPCKTNGKQHSSDIMMVYIHGSPLSFFDRSNENAIGNDASIASWNMKHGKPYRITHGTWEYGIPYEKTYGMSQRTWKTIWNYTWKENHGIDHETSSIWNESWN